MCRKNDDNLKKPLGMNNNLKRVWHKHDKVQAYLSFIDLLSCKK